MSFSGVLISVYVTHLIITMPFAFVKRRQKRVDTHNTFTTSHDQSRNQKKKENISSLPGH